MCFDISTIDIRVSIRACGLHLVFSMFFSLCVLGLLFLSCIWSVLLERFFKVQCYGFFGCGPKSL